MSKVISRLLWFSLCDWLAQEQIWAKFAPFSQPGGSQTRTNRGLVARVFPPLTPVTSVFASNSDWFIARFTFVGTLVRVITYFSFGFAIANHSIQSVHMYIEYQFELLKQLPLVCIINY